MASLDTDKRAGIGWITFNNPAKRNAVTYAMWRALPEALRAFDADPEVRAIVLTGAGEAAFISGADISEFGAARGSADGQELYNSAVVAAFEAPAACSKPVLAAVRGLCYGGGLGLAAACDLRFASADARFRMPAARLGVGYNYPGIKRFVDLIGPGRTQDLFFSARVFDAAEALALGFVNRVWSNVEFAAGLNAYCDQLAENAPLTLRSVKAMVRAHAAGPGARDLAALEELVRQCAASADFREGQAAFREKRAPVFRGC